MLGTGLVIALAVGLAALTYLKLEGLGGRAWLPLGARAVAWSAIGLLLLNVSCPVAAKPLIPLVLLDASLSMSGPTGRWAEARDSARARGDVRTFGDESGAGSDTLPMRGRSLLRPALTAAAASDRPVIVVTDGEIEDAGDIPSELLGRAAITVLPRNEGPDVALTRLAGPTRVTAGDSIALDVEIQRFGGAPAESVAVEVAVGNRVVTRRRLRDRDGASARSRLAFPSAAIGPGDHVLRVRLAGTSDPEPRTDTRLHLVTVAATPGVVLLAAPGDWDSRFLYRTLREVAQLPVRGYVRLDAERWRSMSDLTVVSGDRVRRAARGADLLILKGDAGPLGAGTAARGIWRWPSGETGAAPVGGDWYLAGAEVSPVAGAFVGQPVDSYPPATQLAAVETAPGDWIGLTAQLGRRGAARPAVVGRQQGRVRTVVVAADGLWRWAFRGGASEQSYRTWVASTASWLLGGADSARGVAAPIRSVVENGRPVIFEWVGRGAAAPTPLAWTGAAGPRTDTLRFDGAGRAAVLLPPGEYGYRLIGGGGGMVGVEEFSDELLPTQVTLAPRPARVAPAEGRSAARDWLWLFGVALAALGLEWVARRRLGLR